MPSYKFYYLDLRGRGETIRMLFALGGQPFEDKRLSFGEWGAMKPDVKPMGQLPLLEIDGKMYNQSNAIARYVARKFGYGGKTEMDQLRVDMVVESIDDCFFPLLEVFVTKDDDRKAEIKQNFMDNAATMLGKINFFLEQNKGGNGWFVGDDITMADVYFYNFTDIINYGLKYGMDLNVCPKLKAVHNRVENHPRIAAWIAKRPN